MIDLFYLILRNRRFVLLNVTAITSTALVVSLLLPKWYTSSASLKLSQQADIKLGSLLGGLRDLPGLDLFGLNMGSSNLDIHVALLNSRSILDSMIFRFDLMASYDCDYHFQCRKELLRNTGIRINRQSETLEVSILDKDPAQAKEMLEYYLYLLDQFSRKIDTQEAHNNRLFIEKRYFDNLADLRRAEDSLRVFQEKNQIYLPEEQTILALRAAAELQAELAAGEMELAIGQKLFKQGMSELEKTRMKVEQLRLRLQQMQLGQPVGNGTVTDDALFVPFQKAPALATGYMRLYREVEIQNKLLAFLLPLYEKAKIDENRDTPTIVVIDQPDLPEYKTKPKRAFIVIGAFLFSLIFAVGYLILRNYLQNFHDHASPAMRERIDFILSSLRFRKSSD
jgi:LPS O-antigen subunit length determinant protein (WzzB/FepE family)